MVFARVKGRLLWAYVLLSSLLTNPLGNYLINLIVDEGKINDGM